MGPIKDLGTFEERTHEAKLKKQYAMMLGIRQDQKLQQEKLELLMKENAVLLIEMKRSLYQPWIFSFVNFHKACTTISQYLADIKDKKITRATKCDGKNYYKCMMHGIESSTGIKVKSIDDIIFYGLGQYAFEIYFTESKYGKKLRFVVPDVKNSRFSVSCIPSIYSYDQKEPDYDHLLDDLDMKLQMILDGSDDTIVKLETIAEFPNDIWDFEDFGKRLDEKFGGAEG